MRKSDYLISILHGEELNRVVDRFSKLFMSHLDAEFRKQAIPTLRSLIPDQVRGQALPVRSGLILGFCRYEV